MINQKQNRISLFISVLLFWGSAIQSRYSDDLKLVLDMDFLSLLLSIIMIIIFGKKIIQELRRPKGRNFNLIIIFLAYSVIGFIFGGINHLTLVRFRTMLYLFAGYIIMRDVVLTDVQVIWLFRTTGFVNMVVCLYFYLLNVGIYGSGFRDVSMDLFLELTAIMSCIFVDVKGESKLLKYLNALMCMFTCFTSMQRSVIIPLGVMIMLFIFYNFKMTPKNLMRLSLVLILIYIVYIWSDNIGVFEHVQRRFETMFASESTLWARTNASQNIFSKMSFFNFAFGTGLTAITELEMLPSSYLYKYGIFGSAAIISFIALPGFIEGIKYNNSLARFILLTSCCMSVGGAVSGWEGQQGQFLVGSLMALIVNKKIFVTGKVKYSAPLMKEKIVLFSTNRKLAARKI